MGLVSASMRRNVLIGLAAGSALLLALTACGGTSSSSSSSPSSGQSTPDNLSLSVGLAALTTQSVEIYVAKTKGFFAKHGLTVSITNYGATANTEVAAGRVDLVQSGCANTLPPTASGHQASIVYWMVGNNTSVQVATKSPLRAGATPTDTLLSMSGKRVAVQGSGGSATGAANAMSNYIVAHGGKPLTVVGLPNASAISAQLLSGQIDAAVGADAEVEAALVDGRARILIDGRDPAGQALTGGNYAGVCMWGIQSQLQGKPKAVAAFVAGMRDAYTYITANSVSTVANDLHSNKDFGSLQPKAIADSLRFDIPSLTSSAGFLSSDVWQASIRAYSGFKLTQDPTDPKYAYQNMVDMSYWNAATALIGK